MSERNYSQEIAYDKERSQGKKRTNKQRRQGKPRTHKGQRRVKGLEQTQQSWEGRSETARERMLTHTGHNEKWDSRETQGTHGTRDLSTVCPNPVTEFVVWTSTSFTQWRAVHRVCWMVQPPAQPTVQPPVQPPVQPTVQPPAQPCKGCPERCKSEFCKLVFVLCSHLCKPDTLDARIFKDHVIGSTRF